jgi:hypothetical protein
MHIATIYVKDYFSSKKKIKKLAREINFYSKEKASIQLCFENQDIKCSDLIYLFKNLRITYKEFCEITAIDQFDSVMIFDIAYAILNKEKYLTTPNIIGGVIILICLFGLFKFGSFLFSNFIFYKHVSEVKSKIYYLVDKYNYFDNLKYYYENTNVIGTNSISNTVWFRNNKRTLVESINVYAYNLVKNCDKFNIKYDLKIAKDWNESNFKKFARSNIYIKDKKGNIIRIDHAWGRSQIYLLLWLEEIGIPIDDEQAICDDYNNTFYGCFILRFFIDSTKTKDGKEDLYRALTRYNGGRKEILGNKTIMNTETFLYIQKIYNDRDSISEIKNYKHKGK